MYIVLQLFIHLYKCSATDAILRQDCWGNRAVTARDPDEVSDLVGRSLHRGEEPLLVNVPIARQLPGKLGYG